MEKTHLLQMFHKLVRQVDQSDRFLPFLHPNLHPIDQEYCQRPSIEKLNLLQTIIAIPAPILSRIKLLLKVPKKDLAAARDPLEAVHEDMVELIEPLLPLDFRGVDLLVLNEG